MLTSLDPEYRFTDGPAYIIGEYHYVKANTVVPVYVPSLMTEITKNTNELTQQVERTAENHIFLNQQHPTFQGIVLSTNYIMATITKDFISARGYITLERDLELAQKYKYEYEDERGVIIHYLRKIPEDVIIFTADEADIKSEIGTFKDLKLY